MLQLPLPSSFFFACLALTSMPQKLHAPSYGSPRVVPKYGVCDSLVSSVVVVWGGIECGGQENKKMLGVHGRLNEAKQQLLFLTLASHSLSTLLSPFSHTPAFPSSPPYTGTHYPSRLLAPTSSQ